MPVAKSNGTVRICGDYKTTVNPQLQTEEHPLPRTDNIFAKLAGGQKFTKVDLRQAYHQMEVEEESEEYLTINTHQGCTDTTAWYSGSLQPQQFGRDL